MKKFTALAAVLITITGCTTLTATNNNCMESYKSFPDQATCIQTKVAGNHALRGDSLVQEYVMTAGNLADQVRAGKLTDDDARLKLTEKLNSVKERDIAIQAQQAELFADHGPTSSGFVDCGRSAANPACTTY